MIVRPLKPDDRSGFDCGDQSLHHFFHKYAVQNQWRHHVGATYVAEGGGAILGYSSVSLATIELDDIEAAERRGLPRYSLPGLRLARLASSVDARGAGVGRALLSHAMGLALELRAKAGCVALVVDAKPGARVLRALRV